MPIEFTVFTATFNRAHTLDRLFESLKRQTCRDFEWLVVDDGSTDGTREKVAGFAADFPIVYERQENQGKHVAHNRALALARGAWFVIADSDDELVPEALARFRELGAGLDANALGVVCFVRDGATGRTIGRPPVSPITVDGLEWRLREGIEHDLASCMRTSIARAFPFPVTGEKLVPEGTVWARMMRRHRMLVTGEALEVKHYQADGYTRPAQAGIVRHPLARWLHFVEDLNENGDYLWRFGKRRYLKNILQLARMARHAGKSLGETRSALTRARTLVTLLWPLGGWLARRDQRLRDE